MTGSDLPDIVRALIVAHIDSVVQLEVLLLLQADPTRARTAAEVARELRIDATWVAGQLRQLCDAGLLSCTDQPDTSYAYAPRTPELRDAANELAKAYTERRVTVISLIFSKPVDPIRSFTDAFRLRRKD